MLKLCQAKLPLAARRGGASILALTWVLFAAPLSAAELSGYFRHNAPGGIWVNTESRQTATTGTLTDSNQPIGEILGFYSVDYGSIRLSSRHLGVQDGSFGFSNAGSTAQFLDTLTINSPTTPPFADGTMLARIDVWGNLQATGNGQSHFIVDISAPDFFEQISGSLYGPTVGPPAGVILGDDFGTYLVEIPFTFGHPFRLSVSGSADATVQLNAAGSVWTNLSSTIGWGGILEVRDAQGLALSQFSVTSESGYDYATVVPLPATGWLMLAAAGAIASRVRRRAPEQREC